MLIEEVSNLRIYPRRNIDISNKCGNCKYYNPVIKIDKTGIETQFARGSCSIRFYKNGGNVYKQRTETCKKFEHRS